MKFVPRPGMIMLTGGVVGQAEILVNSVRVNGDTGPHTRWKSTGRLEGRYSSGHYLGVVVWDEVWADLSPQDEAP